VESKYFEYFNKKKPIKIIEYSKEEIDIGMSKSKQKEFKNSPSNRKMFLIKNEENYGFAKGNNIAIKYAMRCLNPEYICLLNNDTVVDRYFLGELIKIAESDEKIGIVGSKVLYYNNPEIINSAGAEYNFRTGLAKNIYIGEIEKEQCNKIREVKSTHGVCMLVRKNVFNCVGYFDERFFIMLEDTDLSIRVRKKGYKLMFSPDSIIYHKEKMSRKKIPLKILYYCIRNRLFLSRKYSKKWVPYIVLRVLLGAFLDYYNEKSHKRFCVILSGLINGLFYDL